MPRGGDEFGISIIVAFLCVLALAFVLAFIKSLIETPWLIGVVILAIVVYMLMKREERREKMAFRRNDNIPRQ